MAVHQSALRTLVNAKYGSLVIGAVKIGVSHNTLYRVVAGGRVSAETRRKIEAAFPGYTLEELQTELEPVTV